MKKILLLLTLACFHVLSSGARKEQPVSRHPLTSGRLATVWDEAVPLGNGLLGALVWQKNGRLRLSLDRADLWDLRPMKGLDRPEFRYRWVYGQVMKHQYDIVQKYFDLPYEAEPAPTKLRVDMDDFGDNHEATYSLLSVIGRATMFIYLFSIYHARVGVAV